MDVAKLLTQVKNNEITIEAAAEQLKNLPYEIWVSRSWTTTAGSARASRRSSTVRERPRSTWCASTRR